MGNDYSFIRPIGVLPMPIPVLPFEFTLQLSMFVGFVLFALLLGFLLQKQMRKQWESYSILNLTIPTIAASLLFLRFGIGMQSIKGLTFCLLLLYAANSDLKTREVSDNISIMIIIMSLLMVNRMKVTMNRP